jgi:hypothetical protein
MDLQNVLVSNPEIVDAVVQSSRQLYLLGKDAGDANAFLFGPDGQKLLLLEVTVARDLSTLSDALNRLLPGSRIKVEAVGDNVVLRGSVLNPIDANRAGDIASRYTKKKDAVVNMLAVASKEQVLLKVQVAEMQRDAMRRIGVNYGRLRPPATSTFTRSCRTPFRSPAPRCRRRSPSPGALPSSPGERCGHWSSGNNSVTALVGIGRAGLITHWPAQSTAIERDGEISRGGNPFRSSAVRRRAAGDHPV